MKNKSGITIITLIITIVSIIILSSIVIFTGIKAPDNAQFAKFATDMENVETAVTNAFAYEKTEIKIRGEKWKDKEIYEYVATGETNKTNFSGTGFIEIDENNNRLKMELPKYENRKWYMSLENYDENIKVGTVLLLPGIEKDGRTYTSKLDITSNGRDNENIESIMKNIESSNMELYYQYGYVIGKFRSNETTDNQLKEAFVNELKNVPDLAIEFNTFEELCSILGVDQEYLLDSIKTSALTMTNANNVNTFKNTADNSIICYGVPTGTGEVKFENTFTKESKSINLTKLDEYMLYIGLERGLAYHFSLKKLENGRYVETAEDYEVTVNINGIQRYSGSVENTLNYFYDLAPELSKGENMEINIVAVINGKNISFKGNLFLGIPS